MAQANAQQQRRHHWSSYDERHSRSSEASMALVVSIAICLCMRHLMPLKPARSRSFRLLMLMSKGVCHWRSASRCRRVTSSTIRLPASGSVGLGCRRANSGGQPPTSEIVSSILLKQRPHTRNVRNESSHTRARTSGSAECCNADSRRRCNRHACGRSPRCRKS